MFELKRLNDQGVISPLAAGIIIVIFVVVAFAVGLSTSHVIEAGHVGVYDEFGKINDNEVGPGLYFIAPWTTLHPMTTQTQQYEYREIRNTLTTEGVEVITDFSVIWHIEPDKASDIYKTVYGSYTDNLITPHFMGILREEVKGWTAEDIYTGVASNIQSDIQEKLADKLKSRGIIIESVLLRGSKFSKEVTASIEAKLTEKQKSEQMVFKVQTAERQAEITLIEAEAQAQRNERIAKSLTPELNNYLLIQALKDNQNVMYFSLGSTSSGQGMGLMLPAQASKNQ